MGLLGPLVGEDEADVGLVRGDGGDAGVHIHVIADGDVVVPVGGQRHVPLAEHGVDEAVVVHAVVIVLLHDHVRVVHMVHPAGDLLVVLALAGDGVHQHRALDVRAAEEADGLHHPGADPVGVALLVDLKHRVGEHEGGIVEPQMSGQIAAEVLGGGVLHALVQADHLRLLGHHVDDQVGGQAVGPVGEPLDEIPVGQGGHPHRAALVVDLGVGGQDLELGDHVAELAQGPAAQTGGGVLVQHGDLVVGDLLHLCGEITGLDGEQLAVASRPQHHPGGEAADDDGGDQGHQDEEGDGALLLHKAEVALHALPLEAGGEDGAHAVHGAQQEEKDVELLRVEVQGGQLEIEVPQAEQQRHAQVDERPGEGVADGLAGLALPPGPLGLGGLSAAEAAEGAGVETSEVECEWHENPIPPFSDGPN